MMLARCPWYVAGPLLGLLIVGLRAAVNKPLGALGGYIDLAHHLRRPGHLGFSAFLLAGIVIGGLLFAVAEGTLSATLVSQTAPPLSQMGLLLVAGTLIGVGARTAGGCTSGHGLCGVSLGSPASVVATMTFFATAMGLAFVLAWFPGGRP